MTLANAAALLHWLKSRRSDIAVGEASAAMGWPKSTTSRLLKNMQRYGFLERDPATRRYRLGLLILERAGHHRAGEPLLEAADAALAELTRQSGHATGISILDGIEVVVLRSRAGTQPLRVVTPPGSRGPAWAASTGRALLARLPDAEIVARFRDFPQPPRPAAPHSLPVLMQRIRRVRSAGWEEASDEQMPGLGGVSVAVADPQTGDAMALYVAFSALHVNRQQRRELAAMLLDVAGQLARRFGDTVHAGAPPVARRAHG